MAADAVMRSAIAVFVLLCERGTDNGERYSEDIGVREGVVWWWVVVEDSGDGRMGVRAGGITATTLGGPLGPGERDFIVP